MPHCLIKYTLYKYKVLLAIPVKKVGVSGAISLLKFGGVRNADVFHFGEEGWTGCYFILGGGTDINLLGRWRCKQLPHTFYQ